MTLKIGSMAMAVMAGAMMSAPDGDLSVVDNLHLKPNEPPRNDEMHLKNATDKRARKAEKRRQIQERNARKQETDQ